MLADLIEKANRLRQRVEELQGLRDVSRESVRSCWMSYEPRDGVEADACGVDSGWNYRLYQGFYVYGLKAAAVDAGYRIIHGVAEVDLVSGDPYGAGLTPDAFLKFRGECHEHEIALRASEEEGLVLVDGSLIARLYEVARRESRPLQTEYMAYVRPLSGRDNVVFVAKYSQDRTLLQGMLGDVFYLNLATEGIGYTMPRRVEMAGVTISVFNIRLTPYSGVLHVETPAVVDEDYVRRIIDSLHASSVKGYPYVLKLSHEVSSFSDTLMQQVCEVAGLTGLELARGVL